MKGSDVSVERVAAFERKAKVKLPADYRTFLASHVEAGDDEVPTFDNVILVANSFTELLAGLRPR
ncbi:MAG: hypothetical protein DI536_17540 [Archangium gephyra]|uniref:Knr4/Smi1-like domain-containing protein n=1 Tax=Archangium gephyra TaxID=48 RepID=A0A2W5T7B1_9BACT|nr:MAG: hypothetical protein DI536_17540 [Archangium gephyra]